MREQAIEWVLQAFAAMGATPDDLRAEREHLETDDRYLDVWASTTGFYSPKEAANA